MTPKHRRFVAEYLKDLNATQAAIRAGYASKNADVVGPRLLRNVAIAEAVKAKTAQQLEKAEVTAQQVKDRIALLAFQDVREFFDANGNLKPVTEFTEGAAARIASFEVIKKNAASGDNVVDTVHKIKTVDAIKNLEMLAKHFGLLVEKIEHGGHIVIKHELGD